MSGHPVSALMIFTLLVVLGLGVFLIVRFRSRHDPHPMKGQRERNTEEIRREGPNP